MVLSNSTRPLLWEGAEYWIGDKLPDGTVYAGVSPDTGNPLYTTAQDSGRQLVWKKACEYAVMLDAQAYRDWRVPTQNELDVLYRGRNLIGGFSMTGWYWSESAASHGMIWVQRFSDGHQFSHHAHALEGLYLRCVRG